MTTVLEHRKVHVCLWISQVSLYILFYCFVGCRYDNLCICIVFVFFYIILCIFFMSIRVLMFFKNWHIFFVIHVILRYSCLCIVFIFLSVLCRILVIFSYRIKFVFMSCSYYIIISYPKLSDLIGCLIMVS